MHETTLKYFRHKIQVKISVTPVWLFFLKIREFTVKLVDNENDEHYLVVKKTVNSHIALEQGIVVGLQLTIILIID